MVNSPKIAALLQAELSQSVWHYREPVVTGLHKKVAVLYNAIDCDGSAVFVLFGCLGTHGAAIVSLSRYVCIYFSLRYILPTAFACQFNVIHRTPMISN